jgi:hypothetical protein
MRRALIPGSRVAVLAVSTARDGRLAAFWRKLVKDLLDPYRPELHYMRGLGPKWREKHGITEPQDGIVPPKPRPGRIYFPAWPSK